MAFEVIQGPGIPSSNLPFSPAVKVGGFVFVSGQASVDVTGKIVVDDFAGEMRRSFDNIQKILAAAGLTLKDVVQVRSYVGQREYMGEYNRIYREIFQPPYPARTTIIECLGESLKFEVEVVAFAGEKRS